jgi:hypothetical protein
LNLKTAIFEFVDIELTKDIVIARVDFKCKSFYFKRNKNTPVGIYMIDKDNYFSFFGCLKVKLNEVEFYTLYKPMKEKMKTQTMNEIKQNHNTEIYENNRSHPHPLAMIIRHLQNSAESLVDSEADSNFLESFIHELSTRKVLFEKV